MSINTNLYEYKDWLIMGSLLLGFLSITDILPTTTNILSLGSIIRFLWLAIIILSTYTYYIFVAKKSSSSFQRSVKTRNLTSPTYKKNLKEQRTGNKNSLVNNKRRTYEGVRERFNRE